MALDSQEFVNALFLMTKYAAREAPMPEHEILAYIQISRWVEQACRIENLKLEAEIRELEGLDENI